MSSLSSVVSDLVRASMGTSVSPSVTDEELDKHVRELLIRDAKKRAEKYGQQGIRAYLASGLSDSNVPKTNKRFLTSVIRNTDEHNKTILRAQALSAEEIKRERREQEMRERRLRAEEAVEAEKMRRSGGSSSRRRIDDSEGWDRWDGTSSDRKRRKRDWESRTYEDDGDERHRSRKSYHSGSKSGDRDESRRHREGRTRSSKSHRHRSRSPTDSRHKSNGESSSSRSKRDRDRSRRYSRSVSVSSSRASDRELHRSRPSKDQKAKDEIKPRKRHALSSEEEDEVVPRRRSRSPTIQSDHDNLHGSRTHSSPAEPSSSGSGLYRESELRKKLKSKPTSTRDTFRSSEKDRDRDDAASHTRRSPSPEPKRKRRKTSRSSSQSSRMSISRSPTPGPEEPGPALPSKMDKYFEESYDPRLDVAPLPAPKVPATGFIDSAEFEGWDAMLDLIRARREDKAEKKRLERMGLSKDEIKKTIYGPPSGDSVSDRWSSEGVSIMDIQYKKRGSVREWDLGKEGF